MLVAPSQKKSRIATHEIEELLAGQSFVVERTCQFHQRRRDQESSMWNQQYRISAIFFPASSSL